MWFFVALGNSHFATRSEQIVIIPKQHLEQNIQTLLCAATVLALQPWLYCTAL